MKLFFSILAGIIITIFLNIGICWLFDNYRYFWITYLTAITLAYIYFTFKNENNISKLIDKITELEVQINNNNNNNINA
jgi:hypothetical protein